MEPGDENDPTRTTRAQQAARVTLALLLLGLGLWTLHEFLPALAWAVIFAIALWPLYQRTRRRFPARGHDIVLPLVFTLGVALLFLVPLGLVGVQLGVEAQNVLHWVQSVQREGVPVPAFVQHLPFGADAVSEWWRDTLSEPDAARDLMHRLNRAEVVSYGRRLGVQLAHRAVLFGFTLVALFFLFRDGAALRTQLLRASHRAFGPRGEAVGEQMVASVHGTVDGLVLVGLGEGVLLGIAYAVLGVPHPTLFGAGTAVAAMIPFGAPVAFGLAALWLLVQGSAVGAVVLVVIGFVVTFVADHFIRPVLIGGATRLPFLWVLLGILGGVETWGLLGLFLGPAIMSALILLWREWVEGPAPGRRP